MGRRRHSAAGWSDLKTFVINAQEKTRVPFLRGILTRALLDAGLTFDDAFALATSVRNDLADMGEVSNDELRRRVLEKLREHGDDSVVKLYRSPSAGPARILVRGQSGNVSAFSRGRHERFLQASGIRDARAERITAMIYDQLLAHGVQSIDTDELGLLTWLCLAQEVGKKAARRYLVWSDFQREESPLLVLIGGAVGSGKSSIATEIAHRLEIVRTQSTDILREVMRMMVPERLLPVLHQSSFEAWRKLPARGGQAQNSDQLVAEGFRSQAELLSVPCEAVLQRAVRESVAIILEGVHVLPGLIRRLPADSNAVAVHVTLAVLRPDELKSRLRGRSRREPRRHVKRYLDNFNSIWQLQSYLLSEADREDAAIITNDERETTVYRVIAAINEELARRFDSDPAEVFEGAIRRLGKKALERHWQELVPRLTR